jgi:putative FmdB family regulatory protein
LPIYEYVCRKCQHGFEALVDSSGKASCPQCESDELEKQLSVFAAGKARAELSAPSGGCGSCAIGPGGNGMCQMGEG